MSYQESAYQNLLFGVSQQAPQDRLPGQLDAQYNMTSDLVAGLRRRPPLAFVLGMGTFSDPTRIKAYNTDLGGASVVILVDTVTGNLRVHNDQTGALLYSAGSSYLQASSARDIRMVTVDSAVWLANTARKPATADATDKVAYPDPSKWGYLYIAAGAYSKTFRMTITDRTGSVAQASVSYLTPNGSSPTDPANSTPEAIAAALVNNANIAGWPATFNITLYREGAYIAIRSNGAVQPTISSDSGTSYVRTSNAMSIRDSAELPAQLPAEADNVIVATGSGNVKVFYRYVNAEKVWKEDANWADMVTLTNMPIRLTNDGVYALTAPIYERRSAGDAKYNPTFKFTTYGVTGLAVFQGRLVLLSNEYACMSASDNPLRFFRASLASLADNDPIEIAAQGSLTAPYEYAVNFNKDLVLFGRRYQGVVPGSGLVTPRTANVSLMTRYEVDTGCEPAVAGRSVFFGAPRSLGYVGVHEMVPSTSADSQYVADDVTAHIPRYVSGPFRYAAASTTSNVLVAGTDAAPNELLVHEYLWSSNEKVHQSWHKWTFAHPVVGAYFTGDVLVLLVQKGTELHLCRLDLQLGAGDSSAQVPRLDYFVELTCTTAGKLRTTDVFTGFGDVVRVFKTAGDNAYLGQTVTEVVDAGGGVKDLVVPEALPGDVYVAGFFYDSGFTPSPPIVKDSKGIPITTTRGVLHQWRVSVSNTGQFTYQVSDAARQTSDYTTTPMRLYSQHLGAGLPLADTATVVIPGRVDMRTAKLELSTDDFYDLNVNSIEYGYRFHQRFRRG